MWTEPKTLHWIPLTTGKNYAEKIVHLKWMLVATELLKHWNGFHAMKSYCSCTRCNPTFYRPATRLREGKVFSRVCLSVCLSIGKRPPCDHYWWYIGPHCTAPHTWGTHSPVPSPSPPRHKTWDPLPLLLISGGNHWYLVQIYSLEEPLSPRVLTSGGVATKTRTVGKWALCILMECFLV